MLVISIDSQMYVVKSLSPFFFFSNEETTILIK